MTAGKNNPVSVTLGRSPMQPYRNSFVGLFVPLLLVAAMTVGCSHSVSSQKRTIDPVTSAAKAMELYDRNQDGKLSADELQQSPALADALKRIDTNSDRAITADEIQHRFESLRQHSALIAMDLTVTVKGRPVDSANVTFSPEAFMADGLQSYTGVTSAHGTCVLQGERVQMPGLPVGYYKVHISQPAQNIDVTRGYEIANDVPEVNRLEIAL
jgi:hypothetical protein